MEEVQLGLFVGQILISLCSAGVLLPLFSGQIRKPGSGQMINSNIFSKQERNVLKKGGFLVLHDDEHLRQQVLVDGGQHASDEIQKGAGVLVSCKQQVPRQVQRSLVHVEHLHVLCHPVRQPLLELQEGGV